MSSNYINYGVASGGGRRVLHQPFFPVQSSPPPPPSGDSFFPSLPTPPPPPPTASALATFPANISSLPVPRSSLGPHANPVSPALIAVTVALSVSAVAIAVFSLFLYFRGRRRRSADNVEEHDKPAVSSRSDAAPPPPLPPVPPGLPPRIPRNSANNSSEFLYLGTMANSAAVNSGGGARRGAFDPRKTDSPDLQPLPPLVKQNPRRDVDVNPITVQEDEEESFYSPRGSASGRESSFGAGSGSRRAFATIPNDATIDTNFSPESSSSGSSSPTRSASLSISPPVSGSTKSSKAKSPEFLTEIQPRPSAPPSPQLPPMSFHSPPPPPAGFSSPESELEARIKKEEEAEESPLLSNASSSSEMSSPTESPTLSPLWTTAGKSSPSPPPAVDWSVFDRNHLSPISDRSTPNHKSPSIKLPRFFGGGRSKKPSPESTKMSNSPMSSPESIVSQSSSSKISYTPSHTARSYPASPIPANGSPRRQHSTPASPLVSSRWSQQSSPEVRHFTNFTAPPPAPPPPPPPPPPAMRRSESPPHVSPETSRRGVKLTEEHQIGVSGIELEASIDGSVDAKPKLKPLHWDKVRASSNKEMVWDQLRSSSFKLNEEMIETLFVVNKPNNPNPKETSVKPVEQSPRQGQGVLDPKKSQNIAISLRALNVTVEEVCESLLEGNAETLGTELLESLLKMAPTKEEEWKLREYKDDSPYKLGHAERFLKTLINIPFAFKRVEAMLYMTNFESEVEYLKKSFETLENACEELRNSRMFLKLLEAVLKTGNRMNVGTNRGDAHAFKLDTLLKLVDVKGTDGKTTLLHFVVQEMIRTEGARLCEANQTPLSDEPKCRKLGLQVVSSLSLELANVKKAAAMDSEALSGEVAKLSMGLASIAKVVSLNEKTGLWESSRSFSESMNKFVRAAEEEIFRVQAQESVALSLVKEITEYFHGDSAKEEAHPFRIFLVVRDFLAVLDRVCKEVGSINDRTVVTSGHRFPVPVNPLLPQVLTGFQFRRNSSSSDGEISL
ncbi:hypothetical protein V2J09_022071 [Rumex salicifolius]